MTSLHLLNDCAEINKMLNVPIQKLSTIHYPLSTIHYPLSRAPAPQDGVDHSRVKQVLFQIKPSMGSPLSPPMELAILTGRWMGVMYSLVQSIPSAL